MVGHLSVQSLCLPVCHCPRAPQVITVGSGAHVQPVKQLDEHQPVFRALDVRASKCRTNESTNHSQDHGFVS